MYQNFRIEGRAGQNFLSIRFSDSTGLITYILNFKVSGINIDNTLIFGIEGVKYFLNRDKKFILILIILIILKLKWILYQINLFLFI